VLLEAWRAGGLKGAAPDEAFRVRCDEATNPPHAVAAGRLLCEIDLAPATPMEFVTIRLTIGRQGQLEVVEQ
jgi:Bacteriophage tail sheath protein